ncbi:hypothetical protein CY35_05G009400 [Sphagnum magellanicum]|nr:hypothetical protein CY35_05G009400 [Sphagnum magellanicum]
MVGWMMRGGWGHSSWLVAVITLLTILELHDMVGVVGTRVPRELLLQNCFKDQNEISKCIQEAQFHARRPLHNTPPYPIQRPPTPRDPPYNFKSPPTPPPRDPPHNTTIPPTPPPQ